MNAAVDAFISLENDYPDADFDDYLSTKINEVRHRLEELKRYLPKIKDYKAPEVFPRLSDDFDRASLNLIRDELRTWDITSFRSYVYAKEENDLRNYQYDGYQSLNSSLRGKRRLSIE